MSLLVASALVGAACGGHDGGVATEGAPPQADSPCLKRIESMTPGALPDTGRVTVGGVTLPDGALKFADPNFSRRGNRD